MKGRAVIGIILLLVMLIGIIFIVKDWNTLFTNKVTIKYADNCEEVYVNNKLTTDECTNGRELERLREVNQLSNNVLPIYNLNITK